MIFQAPSALTSTTNYHIANVSEIAAPAIVMKQASHEAYNSTQPESSPCFDYEFARLAVPYGQQIRKRRRQQVCSGS